MDTSERRHTRRKPILHDNNTSRARLPFVNNLIYRWIWITSRRADKQERDRVRLRVLSIAPWHGSDGRINGGASWARMFTTKPAKTFSPLN